MIWEAHTFSCTFLSVSHVHVHCMVAGIYVDVRLCNCKWTFLAPPPPLPPHLTTHCLWSKVKVEKNAFMWRDSSPISVNFCLTMPKHYCCIHHCLLKLKEKYRRKDLPISHANASLMYESCKGTWTYLDLISCDYIFYSPKMELRCTLVFTVGH